MKNYSRLIGLKRLKIKKEKHTHTETFGFVAVGYLFAVTMGFDSRN